MTEPRILALPRAALPDRWLPERGGLRLDRAELAAALERIAPVWLSRSLAEADPRHKQPIPYILARHRGRFACYWRRGSERRLHGLGSVGIGGHVEAGDAADTLVDTLWRAARRELAEELPGRSDETPLTLLGLINEEESGVGRVHVGLVLLAELPGERPPQGGSELIDLDWLAPDAARQRPLECWSQLALDLLAAAPLPDP